MKIEMQDVNIKQFILLENKECFSLDGDSWSSLKLNIDVNAVKAGIIKTLKPINFCVLTVIASHLNKEGTCFPSQKTISELVGISERKVVDCIKELTQIEINGVPVLVREYQKGQKGFKKSVYSVATDKVKPEELVIDPTPTAEPVEEKVEQKPLTAKDVLIHFVEEYQQAFGDGYIVSWGKEMKLVKEKLLPNFEAEDLLKMVSISVQKYSEKWGNKNFPRPSVSMVCGWLGKEAFKIVLDEKKQAQVFEQRVDTLQQAESEMDRFLSL